VIANAREVFSTIGAEEFYASAFTAFAEVAGGFTIAAHCHVDRGVVVLTIAGPQEWEEEADQLLNPIADVRSAQKPRQQSTQQIEWCGCAGSPTIH
jgi:hypothetical protein